ncbi:hypothetical protein JL101_012050 [Skermanella rosea]|uniref:hypothetical protein n=1 Tax=Skermanella rosea TaxID=1817965 RepID=UPI001934363A|nr:hypothetical protein [Skermanella rosea]UEM06129.1 hypothetical protein JL101_012050 [Skermanella rosea]
MKIGLIAPAASPFGRRLHAGLCRRLGSDVPWLDASMPEGTRMSVGQAGIRWNGHELDRFDALFVHGFRYEDPVIPAADPGTEPGADWSLWQSEHVRRQQRYSFLYSLLSRLEDAPVRLYNGPAGHLAAFPRHHQLERLDQGGLAVARAICTNDPDIARDFARSVADQGRAVVWRTATGKCAWQLFRDRQREHLMGADKPPVLLAPTVDGPLRRAYAIDGRTVLTLEWAMPSDDGLERLEVFGPVTGPLPDAESSVAGTALALSGLRWGSVLYVAGPDGPVIYDVDADPAVTDLPGAMGEHLTGCLAATLAGEPHPTADGLAAAPRDSLFLRRMLRIQFDIERTKHAAAPPA